jgi:hypothetical protein
MSNPSPELLRAMNSHNATAPQDKLDALRSKAVEVREVEANIEAFENHLARMKEKRTKLLREELPQLMDEARVPSITLEAEGNYPSFKLSVKAFYSANVSMKWEEERRKQAYAWLEANGAGDLIKTTVEVAFPREERAEAVRIASMLMELDSAHVTIDERIHPATLTAWLKESVEAGDDMPPLDLIGGTVARVVKIDEVK